MRMNFGNRCLALFIGIIMLFSCFIPKTFGRYVLTGDGILGYAFFTTKITTGTFVITNDDLGHDGGGTATSDNKYGLSMQPVDNDNDGVQDVDSDGKPLYFVDGENYEDYRVENLNENILFTVQNNTDHTLIVLFDITILLGWDSPEIVTTIAEDESKVGLTLVLYRSNYTGTNYPGKQLTQAGNITTNLQGILGNWSRYYAYTATVNPSDYINNGTITNGIEESDLKAFLLINPGETKNYTLSVSYEGSWVGSIDRACYAQITMSVIKYDRQAQ